MQKIINNKLLLITIIIFIFAFFIFRPYFMQERGLLYAHDDESYFAHATALAFFQFPDYSKEYFTVGGQYPMHSIGPGIMAFPFVLSFSLIDRLQDSPIVEKRDISNIIDSWALFGFVISTIFYFYFGVVLLYKALNFYFEERISFFAILFMILFQFFPLYVFRRPIFSHVYEFFLQAVLIYLLIRDSKTKFLNNANLYISVLVGFIIGLIVLVRYNNLFFAILWPIALFCFSDNSFNFKSNWKKLLISYIFGGILIFLFKLLPLLIYKYEAYSTVISNYFLNIKSLLFYIKVFFNMIFGVDFGLFFTAPFLIIGVASLFILKFDFKKRFIIAFLPIIVNFCLVLNSGSTLSWYGYRLIFFSIIAFLIFPFALFLNILKEKGILKKWLIIFFFISIFPIVSMMVFEGNSTNLTLHLGKQYFGLTDWGNKFYQVEVWKTFFLYPKEFFKAFLKGGPLYLIYLIAQIFHLTKFLPAVIIEKYPFFDIRVFIKTIIIYIFPFILYFLYALNLKNKNHGNLE